MPNGKLLGISHGLTLTCSGGSFSIKPPASIVNVDTPKWTILNLHQMSLHFTRHITRLLSNNLWHPLMLLWFGTRTLKFKRSSYRPSRPVMPDNAAAWNRGPSCYVQIAKAENSAFHWFSHPKFEVEDKIPRRGNQKVARRPQFWWSPQSVSIPPRSPCWRLGKSMISSRKSLTRIRN